MIRLICILFLAFTTSVSAATTDDDIPIQYQCEPLGGLLSMDPIKKGEARTFMKTKGEILFVRLMDSKEESFVIYSWKSNNHIFVIPKSYASKDGSVHKFYRGDGDANYYMEITTSSDLKSATTFKMRFVTEADFMYSVSNYKCTGRD